MNIYVVVEGEVGERQLYASWIPLVNPNLTRALTISDVIQNNFVIVIGGGNPGYFDVIEAAIEDVTNDLRFDRLVVAIDSEEASYNEKYQEVDQFIRTRGIRTPHHIIVQHFCLETWALGNRQISARNPQNVKLAEYKRRYDVQRNDPELLPALPEEELNRAQFAEKYLRLLLREKFRNLTYNKSRPGALTHPKYFEQLKRRLEQTTHIPSFSHFLTAFV